MRRNIRLVLALLAVCGASSIYAGQLPESSVDRLPSRLSDQEFWRLSNELSEPEGAFPFDNLQSNEIAFAQVVPALADEGMRGGVYLGVGPEQNFTYIAAHRPRIAFVIDVRRGNLLLHLMYKALFEFSEDRAEFLSLLFNKRPPSGLAPHSSVTALMDAVETAPSAGSGSFDENLKSIKEHLTGARGLPLSPDDLGAITRIYRAFDSYGPGMNPVSDTSLTRAGIGQAGPTYRDLMVQADPGGQGLSYLGSESQFAIVKDLQSRNLVIPVVGNFSGPHTIRAIGRYLKGRGLTIGAFYLSNVESYLRRDNTWDAFCRNVGTMPLDAGSMFIRIRSVSATLRLNEVAPPIATSAAMIQPILNEFRNCVSP